MRKLLALLFCLVAISAYGQSSTPPSAVASFNTRTGAIIPASGDYTTDQLTTSTSGSAPASGKIGEVISAAVTVGSPGTASGSGVVSNITSVSLTAGDWACDGNAGILEATGTTLTEEVGWIGTSPSAQPTAPNAGAQYVWWGSLVGANSPMFGIPRFFISAASTQSVYLNVKWVGSGTTPTGIFGAINCERRD